jgi:murein DD-endopeptidase MepM/ murein hydrolase activator NlpD
MLILPPAFLYFVVTERRFDMQAHPILDPSLPLPRYCEVDLSIDNQELGEALQDATQFQEYLARIMARNGADVLYGGYLERRRLYKDFTHFNPKGKYAREYHLGVDFWAPSGTGIYAPWAGKVSSWANRSLPGDYGPVIILEHQRADRKLFSLYGHLSVDSLEGLYEGMPVRAGRCIARLGSVAENGGYAPHLHFQLIWDLQGYQGDYPGVCALPDLPFYGQNCPDPMDLLGYF